MKAKIVGNPPSALKKFISIIIWPLITALVCLFIFNVLIIMLIVPTGSMIPAIDAGSLCIGNRLAYVFNEPERGDIVIFKHEETDKILVKRVIGMPGDTVTITDTNVLINGEELQETYVNERPVYNPAEYTVPDGSYFVLGDNRNDSLDARYWQTPYIKRDAIIGKLF
jgi:signal peptidase I